MKTSLSAKPEINREKNLTMQGPTFLFDFFPVGSKEWINLLSDSPGLLSPIHNLMNSLYRHDPPLAGHCLRTAEYALPFGRAVCLSQGDLGHLLCAALLHDIGKLTLPQSLSSLHEVNRLGDYIDPDCSPREGANLLKPWPVLHPAATLIFHHHERWDGRGTPFGVRGTFIPLGARIIAICDIFDRLTHSECTTTTHDVFSSLRILRSFSGTRYDPDLVATFSTLFDSSFGNRLRQSDSAESFSGRPLLWESESPGIPMKKQFLPKNSWPFRLELDSP